ncbi:MAG: Asp-tRNA(Asn)/Glu-tRNA(Gln) amidotransferase subunit GatC [Spirochaetales bacterium]|nr:Asp-tRNA(Asn)/Glu-tRNA(Gln) amidotransferase subunit GatC [Spirochaetales bacterium]
MTLTTHYVKFVTMEQDDLIITAAQAQLELSAEEEGRLAAAVTEMLDYFSKMSEVDVDNLAPTTHALVTDNALRTDTPNQNNNQKELVDRAPDNENNFIVIPNVL